MYLWKNDDAVSIELAFSTEKEMISNLFNNFFDTTAMKKWFLNKQTFGNDVAMFNSK